MKFNLVSKNNIGYASALFLIVLLSQSKFFNFLIDTTLGRSILILFILLIAYTNKILGVVVVLFIIIMFNNSDIGYLEGMTSNSNSSTTNSNENDDQKKKNALPNSPLTPSVNTLPVANESENDNTIVSVSSSASTAVEGFDLASKERWIQKGKQSNQVPVNDFMKESPSISPYEGSSFSESFANY
jgi:hypothetical protein